MRTTTAKPVPPLPKAAALPKHLAAEAGRARKAPGAFRAAAAGAKAVLLAPPRNSVAARRASNHDHVFNNVVNRDVKGQHTAALQWKESHLKLNAETRDAEVDHQWRLLSASSVD
jgi:hypothetical protein